jgi:hypothetical protein
MQDQGDREGFHAWSRIKDAIADMDRKAGGASGTEGLPK